MNKKIIGWLMLLTLWLCQNACALEMTPGEIIAKYENNYYSQSRQLVVEMTVIKSGVVSIKYLAQISVKDKDCMLVRILEPIRHKNTGFLRIKDTIWIYLPDIGKATRSGFRQNMLGSDASNSDVLGADFLNEYNQALLGTEIMNGGTVFVIQLKAKERSAAYDQVKMWITANGFVALREEFYTVSGKLLRVLENKDIRAVNGYNVAFTTEVTNMLLKGNKTILTLKDVEIGIDIPERNFTVGFLEKGI
jgi:outer membrane lipoprotein-sorting protein